MLGSNVEETSEQPRGREVDPTAQGRGRKDKSRDAIANMEARLAKVELAMADTQEGVDVIELGMEKGLEDLRDQIQDLCEGAPRVEVPKPHMFNGKRDAKDLDNFLSHMERHFEAIALKNEAIKVCTTTLNLTDNAILWWRQRFDDMEKDIFTIETLDMPLCQEILFTHAEILEIPDMTEEELLFNFMDNLQGWVEKELKCRGVQDLATAMVIEKSLIDYKREDSSKVEYLEDSHTTGGGNEVSRDHNTPRLGLGKTPNVQEGRGKVEKKEFTPKMKCFLCDGPHWAQDCPKRETLSAMIEERE
uniref:Ty3 transposon capsid-like protein domain-containing protein n=1 Tax=Vitis vinifera TaxID=29760 RepID=A5BN84_VITVI|nr:hypothetical protein VITISV_022508 [Vitis vinifera]